MDSFFGIGMFELVMIAVIALIVLGPERLPGAMREVGKYARQIRDVSNEFQTQFSEELKVLDEINPKRMLNEVLDPKQAPPAAQAATQPVAPPAVPPAWPAATHPPKPAAPPVAPPPAAPAAPPVISNAEPNNSILPPARQDPPAPPVSDSAGNPAEPPASDANPGLSSDGAPGAVQ